MELINRNIWQNSGFLGFNYSINKENLVKNRKIGNFIFDKIGPMLNGKLLEHSKFDTRESRLTFNLTIEGTHKAADIIFYENCGGFIGSMQNGKKIFTVKGLAEPVSFNCRLDENNYDEKKLLHLSYIWSSTTVDEIVPRIKLGKEDISELTSIKRDKLTGQLILKKVPSKISNYSFKIRIDSDKNAFNGEICYSKKQKYRWRGTSVNNNDRLLAADSCLQVSASNDTASDTNLMELLNIDAVRIYDDKRVDRAKELSLTYYGGCMINSVEDDLRNFLGIRKYDLPPEVEEIKAKYSSFFEKHAVLFMANMLYKDMIYGDEFYSSLAKKIDLNKVHTKISEISKEKEYKEIFDKLYVVGYRYGVPEIRPYLDKNSENWAIKLYEYITCNRYLGMWRRQVGMANFDKTEHKISSIYNKLLVLDNSENGMNRALDAMLILTSSILTLAATEVKYHDDNKSLFKDVISSVGKGILAMETSKNDMHVNKNNLLSENVKKDNEKEESEITNRLKNLIQDLTDIYGDFWVDKIVDALKTTSTNSPISGSSAFSQLIPPSQQITIPEANRAEMIAKIGKVIGFCIVLGTVITVFVKDAKNLTISQISDIVIASVKFVGDGAIEILDFLFVKFASKIPFDAIKKLGEWTSGSFMPSKWVKLIFGENGKIFLAFRLAPVLLLATVIVSCVDLAKKWHSYDDYEKAIGILNITFMGTEAVMLILTTCCPVCGVIATVLGVISILVLIIDVVYKLFKPAKPPKNAATLFINETLKEKGLLK